MTDASTYLSLSLWRHPACFLCKQETPFRDLQIRTALQLSTRKKERREGTVNVLTCLLIPSQPSCRWAQATCRALRCAKIKHADPGTGKQAAVVGSRRCWSNESHFNWQIPVKQKNARARDNGTWPFSWGRGAACIP